jgi:hypothetical protein
MPVRTAREARDGRALDAVFADDGHDGARQVAGGQ